MSWRARLPVPITPTLIVSLAEVKYDGYIKRQAVEVERLKRLEQRRIPQQFDYGRIPGLSSEARARLVQRRPLAFEMKGRRSRDDSQAFDLPQRADDVFGDPVREVFVFFAAAPVLERQDNDRRSRLADSRRRPRRFV